MNTSHPYLVEAWRSKHPWIHNSYYPNCQGVRSGVRPHIDSDNGGLRDNKWELIALKQNNSVTSNSVCQRLISSTVS